MAKIAYVGLPAHGHTNPTLPVMKELVRRGHEVYYYNAESFRDKVSPTGVHFQPLPEPMPSEREISEALYEFINAPLIFSRMSRPLARYLIGEFERQKPDLVIYDSAAMWGYIAAFAGYPAQFILSTGKHTAISQLGEIPDNFMVYNYVPQLDILQQVDAFII